MTTRPRGRGSITLVEAILAGVFLLGLAITLLVITDRTREKAEDHAVAEQLTELHSFSVDFNENDQPSRALSNRQALSAESVELLLELKPLRYLNLNHSRKVGPHLRRLATHPGLSQLALVATDIDDSALPQIAALHDLRWLDLRRTDVTSRGLTALQSCVSLVELNLDETLVDDALADAVRAMPSLQRLTVRLTQVTDDGLAALAAIPQLRILDVSGALVTRTGLAAARSVRPDLSVEWRQVSRIGSWNPERRSWARQRLSEQGVETSRGVTVIPPDKGDELAFALMYAQPGNLRADHSQLSDAAVPMLLASYASTLHLGGTSIRWERCGDGGQSRMFIRSYLDLSRSQVNDVSLTRSHPLMARQILLSDTRVGDTGLQALVELLQHSRPSLSRLRLDGTQITDAGEESLRELLRLPYMKMLDVRRTALTPEVLARLRESSPRVELLGDDQSPREPR